MRGAEPLQRGASRERGGDNEERERAAHREERRRAVRERDRERRHARQEPDRFDDHGRGKSRRGQRHRGARGAPEREPTERGVGDGRGPRRPDGPEPALEQRAHAERAQPAHAEGLLEAAAFEQEFRQVEVGGPVVAWIHEGRAGRGQRAHPEEHGRERSEPERDGSRSRCGAKRQAEVARPERERDDPRREQREGGAARVEPESHEPSAEPAEEREPTDPGESERQPSLAAPGQAKAEEPGAEAGQEDAEQREAPDHAVAHSPLLLAPAPRFAQRSRPRS